MAGSCAADLMTCPSDCGGGLDVTKTCVFKSVSRFGLSHLEPADMISKSHFFTAGATSLSKFFGHT